MRVNIYAEEMTDRVDLVFKTIEGTKFTAVRFYLELPVTTEEGQVKGPFMHREGDDDSSAVTFWGKRDLRPMLRKALGLLDQYYGEVSGLDQLKAEIEALPMGTLGTDHAPVPPYHIDRIPAVAAALQDAINKRNAREREELRKAE